MGIIKMHASIMPQRHAEAEPKQFRLGLQCRPSAALPLFPGKTYALNLRSGAGHVRLLYTSLEANLAQGARCALMTPMAPDTFFQRLGKPYSSRLQDAIRTGQLTLLTMVGDYQQNLVRFGPEKFTKEWAQCGVTEGTLLIIDCAEQIFSLHHPDLTMAQVNTYRQWIEKIRCSTLYVFSAKANDGQGTISRQRVLDHTSGSAHIDCQSFPAQVWVDFWDAGTEILPEQRLEWVDTQHGAQSAGHMQIKAANHLHPSLSSLMESIASDIEDVFCLGGEPIAFRSRKQLNWRRVHDLIDLLHATRNAKAAVVLIHVSRDTNWLHLAQAVHTMRQHCGAQLRVAILDRDSTMRYQNELLLLQLGANTVVHGQAAITRLPLLLQSLLSQQYVSSKLINFDKAIVSATPPDAKGYLPPGDFYREVLSALAKSGILGVPCALLVSPVPAGQDSAAVINRFKLSRQGDLITANKKNCYVFLYGYATNEVQALLPRLLHPYDARAAYDISLINDEQAIVAALSEIEDEEGLMNQILTQAPKNFSPFAHPALSAT